MPSLPSFPTVKHCQMCCILLICIESLLTGNHCAVLCLVLLLAAPNTAMEQYKFQMERVMLHVLVDGSSDPLADVGLPA